jgi:hypothetical protein
MLALFVVLCMLYWARAKPKKRRRKNVHQDVQAFLKEVDASLETLQIYEVLTTQGTWRRVRVSWVSHDYAHPEDIDAATMKVIDLENGASITLFGVELPVRLRERGQAARQTIAETDIQQVINRDIVGRACETISSEGWLRTYVDLLELPDLDWYHARVRVGRTVILQGVEIVTRLRFPTMASEGRT